MHRAAVVPVALTALWLPPADAAARPPTGSVVIAPVDAPSPQASFFTPSSAAPRPTDVTPSNGRRNTDTTWVILGLFGGTAAVAAVVWVAARRRASG
jgi:hypothetical protein